MQQINAYGFVGYNETHESRVQINALSGESLAR
jgi:hypothetical protein